MFVRFFFRLHLAWAELGGLAHGFGFEGGLDMSIDPNCKLCLKSDKRKWCSDLVKFTKAAQILFLLYLRIKYQWFS